MCFWWIWPDDERSLPKRVHGFAIDKLASPWDSRTGLRWTEQDTELDTPAARHGVSAAAQIATSYYIIW